MNSPRRKTASGPLWAPVIIGALPALLLAGCSGAPDSRALQAPAPAAHQARSGAPPPATPLDAELLYDLLVTEIAGQRGQHQAALEAVSRAAYRSRDLTIIAQAVRLAVRLNDHQRVIELSRFMAGLDPDNSRNLLALADAQLKIGQDRQAFAVLTDLARKQGADEQGESVLQSIASLLGKSPSAQILPRFRAAIASWPQSPELKLTAALLALELDQGLAFQDLIEQALRLRPGWEIAAIFQLTYLFEHFPVQAPHFADGFLRQFPGAARFRIGYGRMLLEADQPAQSAAQLETVLEQNPQSSEALFVSAIAHFEQEQFATALKRMRRYLALNPRSDQARLYIADIHIAREQFEAAVAVLQEVGSPGYRLDAQIALASVLARRHGVEAGIRHLGQIAVINRQEAVRMVLEQARLYEEYDSSARAKAVLDAGLERFPAHPELLYNRGLLAAQLNLLDLHERDMRQLIGQQPDNAHAYNALGYTLADQTDRLDEAYELISKALALMPDDPFILDSMGWVNFRIGNNDKAIEYLRRALAVRKDAEIAAHLGEVLWVVGNKKEAREIWEQGKSWSPDNATLLDTLKRFSSGNSSGNGMHRQPLALSPRPSPPRPDARPPAPPL
ncbi:MAG: tetratricopeptide repeat protein [Gammaproteobacteria bacterium]|nr:tetratricopeptide repeat protein [Gammaproteobacteria bacterium]